MARLAWFSPLPPVRTGVAAYGARSVEALGRTHLIDVYPESSAHDFIWKHQQGPYDLVVYQMGNSSHHDYIWPYLFRFPGLVVLHDVHLHHARAAALLSTRRADDYRADFAACHPDVSVDLAELAVAGFDNHLYYCWPMTRLVVESSRATAVHTTRLAEELRRQHPSAAIHAIRMTHGEPLAGAEIEAARARVRALYGIRADDVVFGILGGLTPEKRVSQVLDALAAVRSYVSNVRLVLAGAAAQHYDVAADVRDRGLTEIVTITGYLESDRAFTDHLAACDVSLNLRWPTAREVSGPWLRALAVGRATITVDLAHMTDAPSLDPRTWRVRPSAAVGDRAAPVTVAIDILDEDHSLRLAMRRLASDPDLRSRLGAAARAYWRREHSPELMAEDYNRAIASSIGSSAYRHIGPSPDGPIARSPDRKIHELLEPFGLGSDLWSAV